MRDRFKVKKIDQTIIWEGEDHTIEYDEHPPVEVDLNGAVDALNSDCWDNIDERSTEIICYPADSHMDIYTGHYEQTQVVITGAEKDLLHLMTYWRAKNDNSRTG